MAGETNIEWTDATWNPIVGCSIVSPGCTNCYAMAMAARIDKMTLSSHYEGLTHKVNGHQVWTGKVALAPEHILTAPLRWRKPKRVFVNSMGDLFHEDAPDEWIDRAFAVMALAPRHQFQVLTKRAGRMRAYVAGVLADQALGLNRFGITALWTGMHGPGGSLPAWPLPNVWLGVSAERQQEADERIPLLLQTPATVRFVSLEPLLGPIDLRNIPYPSPPEDKGRSGSALDGHEVAGMVGNCIAWVPPLDWVIVGGESGHRTRMMDLQWARDLRDQCQRADVAYFFKQTTGKKPIPDDLLVRQFPR